VNSPELKSELGSLQLFTFGFGTIVGIAWVVLMGQVLGQAGLLGVFIGLSIGALMMGVVGLCYAEVGTYFPIAGGEIAYVRHLYGVKTSHVLGWFLLLSCILVCGFEMVSVGWITSLLWPNIVHTRLYSILGNDVYLEPLVISIGVQGVIAAVNYIGARGAGRLQAITTGGKILLSACFIVAGLRVANTAYSKPLFVEDAVGSIWPGVISVVTIAPFWFSGFNAISQTFGERSRKVTAKHAANMIITSLAAAWVFYSLVLLSMSLIMPRQELLSYPLPTAAAFQAAFRSPVIGNIVLFAGLLGLVSTWNALFFSATRILLVLAADGFVSPMFRTLHLRFGSPKNAILFLAVLIPVLALLGKGVIGPLLSSFSIVMAGIYAMVCVGVIILRRRTRAGIASGDSNWTVLPCLALCACAAIEVFALIEPIRGWHHGRPPLEWLFLLAWGSWGIWLARKDTSADSSAL
jgi:basic amino acid/polyamine antiporter, APA family